MRIILTFAFLSYFNIVFCQSDTTILLNGPSLFTSLCNFTLSDLGGPEGDYSDQRQDVIGIKPDSTEGFEIVFEELITEECCDFLVIEAFQNHNLVFLEFYSGVNDTEVLTIEADSLAIQFVTNLAGTDEGFIIHVNCKKEVPPEVDFSAYSTVICDNILQLYDDSFLAPTSWTWKVQGEVVATTENATVILDAPGLYDVELVACNDYGCDSLLREKYITFSDDPQDCPVAELIFADTISIVGCNGEFSSPADEPFLNNKTAYSTVYAPNASAIDISFVDFELKQGDALEVYGENGLGYELLDKLTESTVQEDFSFMYNSLLFVWKDKSAASGSAFTAVYSCVLAGDPVADFSKDSLFSSCRNIQFYDESSDEPFSWEWYVDGEWVSDLQHPILPFYEADTFDVTLITCNYVDCDTLTLQDFVIIDDEEMDCNTIYMRSGIYQLTSACSGSIIDAGGIYNNNLANSFSSVEISPIAVGAFNLDIAYIDVRNTGDTLRLFKEKNGVWLLEEQWTTDASNLDLLVIGNRLRFEWSSSSAFGDRGFEIDWSCIPLTEVVADFEIDSSLICGSILTFYDRSVGFPDTYEWKVNGAAIGSESAVNLLSVEAGSIDIQLIVCNPLGCDSIVRNLFFDPTLADCDSVSMTNQEGFLVQRCEGFIMDDGGTEVNYGNDLRQKTLVFSSQATGYEIDIQELSIAENDSLKIWMGDDPSNLFLKHSFSNMGFDPYFLTVGSYLEFEMITDGTTNKEGFVIHYQCIEEALAPVFVLDYNSDSCTSLYQFELISNNSDSIVWTKNDDVIGMGENSSYEFVEVGEQVVEVRAWNDFGMTMDSIELFNETPGIYYEVEDSLLLNTSLDIFLQNPDPADVESVEWYLDGEFVTDEFAIDFVLEELRVYDLSCIVTLNDGCVLTKNTPIKAVLFIGVEELLASVDEWSIFPVPSNEVLYIHSKNTKHISKIEVRNSIGQVQLSREVSWSSSTNPINISELSNGMYVVSIIFSDGSITSKNIVVLKS